MFSYFGAHLSTMGIEWVLHPIFYRQSTRGIAEFRQVLFLSPAAQERPTVLLVAVGQAPQDRPSGRWTPNRGANETGVETRTSLFQGF